MSRGIRFWSAGVAVSAICWAMHAVPADDALPLETHTVPKLKELKRAGVVASGDYDPHEGWVQLSMMIDPQGRPYEIAVVDSAGLKGFERAAIASISKSTFEPARSGTEAIHAGFDYRYWFAFQPSAKKPSGNFNTNYNKLQSAIKAGDRSEADYRLRALDPQTIYEDSFRHLALYDYQRKWGTESQQVRALRGAIAGEELSTYLPRKTYIWALDTLLTLEVRRNDFGAALGTWQKLSALAPKERLDALGPMMAEVDRVMKSPTPVRISAEIDRGTSWFTSLFRSRFRIDVQSGAVADLRLRCARGYVQFRYQPGMEYSVSAEGPCGIEVVGDPQSRFDLIQL